MKRPAQDKAVRAPAADKARWICGRCGHANSLRSGHCAKCRLQRPIKPARAAP